MQATENKHEADVVYYSIQMDKDPSTEKIFTKQLFRNNTAVLTRDFLCLGPLHFVMFKTTILSA